MKPEPPAARDSAGTFPVALLPRICQRAVPVTFRTPILALLPALCLAACSGTGGDTAGETAAAALGPDAVGDFRMKGGDPVTGDPDQSKIEAKYGSFSSYSTGKDGKPLGEGKEFAGFKRDNPEFKGRWDNKEYKAGEYRKKSWWGDRDYVKKVYGGSTDANSLRKNSRFNGKSANEGHAAFHGSDRSYRTDRYATGAANEASRSGISKASDAETDQRRRVFTEPDIIPQSAMTVEDTNRMLGR